MSIELWFLLIGLLMLSRGLGSRYLQRLPFTSANVYLAVGLLLGPTILNLFYFDPIKQSAVLEKLTEFAVLISLFSAGVKMPVPVQIAHWHAPLRLASISMVLTVSLIAAFAYIVLELPLGACVLLGAVLAPTDPVLAADTQSRFPGDKDQLRFTLTCEAGMNDGAAFPFVMLGLGLLGLHELGAAGWRWLVVDVVWATAVAIGIGVLCGVAIGKLVWRLRGANAEHDVLDDLVGLGLIAIVYGLSEVLQAWGFLAVFFTAVALRHTELKLVRAIGVKPEQLGAGVAEPVVADEDACAATPPIVSAETLVFKEHLERLSELMLVLLVGGMLFLNYWNWQSVSLAIFVFVVARPVSVAIGLIGTQTSWRVRGIAGWFGVRGIGSVYYLMYAIQLGLPDALARELTYLTLIVVALSIVVHGTSVKPLLNLLWRRHGK